MCFRGYLAIKVVALIADRVMISGPLGVSVDLNGRNTKKEFF